MGVKAVIAVGAARSTSEASFGESAANLAHLLWRGFLHSQRPWVRAPFESAHARDVERGPYDFRQAPRWRSVRDALGGSFECLPRGRTARMLLRRCMICMLNSDSKVGL